MAHLLDAAHQDAAKHEEEDGAEGGQAKGRSLNAAERTLGEFWIGDGADQGEPADGNHCGNHQRQRAWAILEGLQDLADRVAVIVGGQ